MVPFETPAGFAGAESGEVQVDDIIVTIDNQVLLEKVVDEVVPGLTC